MVWYFMTISASGTGQELWITVGPSGNESAWLPAKKMSCGKAIYENDMTHFPSQIGVSKFRLPFHIPSQFDDLFFESHRGQRSQGMRPQSGLKGTTRGQNWTQKWCVSDMAMDQYLWKYHFSGMNIHKSQLFWCEQKGYYWFWPIPIWKEIGELFFACLGIKFWPIARWNTI